MMIRTLKFRDMTHQLYWDLSTKLLERSALDGSVCTWINRTEVTGIYRSYKALSSPKAPITGSRRAENASPGHGVIGRSIVENNCHNQVGRLYQDGTTFFAGIQAFRLPPLRRNPGCHACQAFVGSSFRVMEQTPSLGLSANDNEGGIARPDSVQNVVTR